MSLPSLFLPPGTVPNREAYLAQAIVECVKEPALRDFSVEELAQQMALVDLATWTEIIRRQDQRVKAN